MKTKIIILSLVFFLINSAVIYPQVELNKTAQSTMNFLLVGTSPKAAAMGEAFTVIGTGSEAMFYNPAGIAGMSKEFDIVINYTGWIADIIYLSGGAVWNFGTYGAAGISLLTVDYGTINGTGLIDPGESGLYPLGYKDNGEVSNVGAYAVGLTYAKAISQAFSIGGNIKIAGQNLGTNNFGTEEKENNAVKLVFDAGVKYVTDVKGFMFGMSIRNFSTNIKREEIDEQLPLLFTLGASFNLMEIIDEETAVSNPLLVAADFLHPNNYSERMNIGMEYTFRHMIALRAGWQTNRDIASWSAGLGFHTSVSNYDFELNYSYSKFDYFDNVQRFSINFSF